MKYDKLKYTRQGELIEGTLHKAFDENDKDLFKRLIDKLFIDNIIVQSEYKGYKEILNKWDWYHRLRGARIINGGLGYRIITDGLYKVSVPVR